VGSNSVKWSLGTIPVGAAPITVGLQATAVATSDRQVCNRASAVCGPFVVQSEPACIEIVGVPAINVEVLPNANPVVLKNKTTYFIKVSNRGSKPLTITRLECDIPPEMTFESGISPTGQKAPPPDVNRRITFDQPIVVPVGQAGIYEVQVKAVRAGKTKFVVHVESRDIRRFTQEQSTTIIDPDDANNLPQARAKGPSEGRMLSMPVKIDYGSQAAPSTVEKPMPTIEIPATNATAGPLRGPALERPVAAPVSASAKPGK
jgi:hypothetical protein